MKFLEELCKFLEKYFQTHALNRGISEHKLSEINKQIELTIEYFNNMTLDYEIGAEFCCLYTSHTYVSI